MVDWSIVSNLLVPPQFFRALHWLGPELRIYQLVYYFSTRYQRVNDYMLGIQVLSIPSSPLPHLVLVGMISHRLIIPKLSCAGRYFARANDPIYQIFTSRIHAGSSPQYAKHPTLRNEALRMDHSRGIQDEDHPRGLA